jgi:hypothetical protein
MQTMLNDTSTGLETNGFLAMIDTFVTRDNNVMHAKPDLRVV